jgi:hypothetical protein
MAYDPKQFNRLRQAIAPQEGYFYPSMIPIKRNLSTGERSFTTPLILREALLGALDLAEGTQTGMLTPRAAATLPMFMTGGLLAGAPKGAIISGVGKTTKSASKLDNPNFRKWFGESKVVDEAGQPLTVYHGTPDNREIMKGGFKPSPIRGDVYFFTDNKSVAKTYADPKRAWDYQGAEPDVITSNLSIKNPLVIDAKGKKWRETEKYVQEAKNAGYDGIIIKNSRDEYNNTKNGGQLSTVYAAFKPTQIKSTMNRGTYDPNDPNILNSTSGALGMLFPYLQAQQNNGVR